MEFTKIHTKNKNKRIDTIHKKYFANKRNTQDYNKLFNYGKVSGNRRIK